VIFDILVPFSRYSNDSPSAVRVLFECNLANRDFWPYVFTGCNLCARGQETGGSLTERYAFVDEVAPTSPETSFFGGL
jgi:uroporphyrinogen-III synthase